MFALEHRRKTGVGQVVDVALYESVFSVMESLLPEFDAFGAVRERTGSILPGIAPTSAYRASDGSYVLIAGNGDSIFKRLCTAMGRNDLANDASLAHNDGRAAKQAWLDGEIEAWTLTHAPDEILAAMDKADVPASKIYSIRDIVDDAQYQARQMIREIRTAQGDTLKVRAWCRDSRPRPAASRAAAPASASTRSKCCASWATRTSASRAAGAPGRPGLRWRSLELDRRCRRGR